MAKLFFRYSAMNAGKSTSLLQIAYNYEEQGQQVHLYTAAIDDRSGVGSIASRLGIHRPPILSTIRLTSKPALTTHGNLAVF